MTSINYKTKYINFILNQNIDTKQNTREITSKNRLKLLKNLHKKKYIISKTLKYSPIYIKEVTDVLFGGSETSETSDTKKQNPEKIIQRKSKELLQSIKSNTERAKEISNKVKLQKIKLKIITQNNKLKNIKERIQTLIAEAKAEAAVAEAEAAEAEAEAAEAEAAAVEAETEAKKVATKAKKVEKKVATEAVAALKAVPLTVAAEVAALTAEAQAQAEAHAEAQAYAQAQAQAEAQALSTTRSTSRSTSISTSTSTDNENRTESPNSKNRIGSTNSKKKQAQEAQIAKSEHETQIAKSEHETQIAEEPPIQPKQIKVDSEKINKLYTIEKIFIKIFRNINNKLISNKTINSKIKIIVRNRILINMIKKLVVYKNKIIQNNQIEKDNKSNIIKYIENRIFIYKKYIIFLKK